MNTTEFIAVLGIAGTLLGTLLGLAGTFVLELAKWRREDRTRFRSDLYQRCVDLYVANVLWHGRAYEIPQEGRNLEGDGDLFNDMVTALSHVQMIASGELADAATRLVHQSVEFDPADDPEDDERSETLEDLREAFNEAARKELGVQVDPGAVRRILAARRRAGPELDG